MLLTFTDKRFPCCSFGTVPKCHEDLVEVTQELEWFAILFLWVLDFSAIDIKTLFKFLRHLRCPFAKVFRGIQATIRILALQVKESGVWGLGVL